jgi:hypothetical protein
VVRGPVQRATQRVVSLFLGGRTRYRHIGRRSLDHFKSPTKPLPGWHYPSELIQTLCSNPSRVETVHRNDVEGWEEEKKPAYGNQQPSVKRVPYNPASQSPPNSDRIPSISALCSTTLLFFQAEIYHLGKIGPTIS